MGLVRASHDSCNNAGHRRLGCSQTPFRAVHALNTGADPQRIRLEGQPESANSPRTPPAVMAIDNQLVSAVPAPGVNLSAPLPYPATPHTVIRSVTL